MHCIRMMVVRHPALSGKRGGVKLGGGSIRDFTVGILVA